MISTFVWQGKKARIRKRLLCSSKGAGGLSLPNFKMYYWAAQLRAIVEWVIQDMDTNWLWLENISSPSVPLETALFLEQKKWRELKIQNEWMACTHRIWSMLRKKLGIPLTTSHALQIAKLSDFPPSKIDPGFLNWAERGLITVHQMFDGEILKSFKQLQDKHGLSSKDYFRYLQIREYIRSSGEWESLKRLPTSMESYLIKNITEKNKKKNGFKFVSFPTVTIVG